MNSVTRLLVCCLYLAVVHQSVASAVEELSDAQVTAVKSALVFVRTELSDKQIQGSGFMLQSRLVVTCAHVVGALEPGTESLNRPITVCFNSGSGAGGEIVRNARLVAVNQALDLAYLRLSDPAPGAVLRLADPKGIKEPTPIFLAGFQADDQLTIAMNSPNAHIVTGSLAKLYRDAGGRLETVQIAAPLVPNTLVPNMNRLSRGGPLLNAQCEVVGVAGIMAKGQGLDRGLATACEQVTQDLTASMTNFSFTSQRSGGAAVAIITRDPQEQFSKVMIETWQGDPGASRTLDPTTQYTLYGAAGDGQRTRTALVKGDCGKWSGKVALREPAPGKIWLYRPVAVGPGSREVTRGVMAVPTIGEQQLGIIEIPSKPAIPTTWKPPLVSVITPVKAAPALVGQLMRDAQGRSFSDTTSVGVKIDLGKQVIAVAVAPSGAALYVLRRGAPLVEVVDPATWKTTAEIQLPQPAVAVWVDSQVIAVACQEGAVVVLIDPLTVKHIRAVRCPELAGWYPDTICGRGPDGSLSTLWQKKGGGWNARALVQIGLDGAARVISQLREPHWGAWLPGGRAFFLNHPFSGSPAGVPELLYPSLTPTMPGALTHNMLFGSGGFHTDTGAVFTTHDGTALVLPRTPVDEKNPSMMWTYLVSPDVKQILLDFPGAAVCEVPDQRLFVTFDCSRISPGTDRRGAAVRYIARSTGRVLRVVHLTFPRERLGMIEWLSYPRPNSGAIFIPGHEILLMPDTNTPPHNMGKEYTAFACGPLTGELAAPAGDPTVVVTNDPPQLTKAGRALSYQPAMTITGGTASTFRIKRALSGMAIDAATGTWTWKPTAAQTGTWQVTILAVVAGLDIPVITWSLTVE